MVNEVTDDVCYVRICTLRDRYRDRWPPAPRLILIVNAPTARYRLIDALGADLFGRLHRTRGGARCGGR